MHARRRASTASGRLNGIKHPAIMLTQQSLYGGGLEMGVIGAAMRSHTRGTDAVPRPHSLRVPVTDCVRGRDGLSYPHERAIKLARGASRDIATVDGAAGGAVV